MVKIRCKKTAIDSFFGNFIYERIIPRDHFLLKLKEIVLGHRFDHDNNKDKIKKFENQIGAIIKPKRAGWEDYKIRKCGYWTDQYEK